MTSSSRLVEFYLGKATDNQGRRLADLLAWPDDVLEEVHDFIQWMFPLPESSQYNADAPLLMPEDITAFHTMPELRASLLQSFRRILSFLGLALDQDGAVVEAENFASRVADVWSTPNHNWLRITRILRSLTLLGLNHEATRLFQWLDVEYTRRRFPMSDETMRYWRDAVGRSD